MPIKIGEKNKNFSYSKIYLGEKLKYQKITFELIGFSSCPFPTSWTAVTEGTSYRASNSYGQWTCTSDGCGASSLGSFGVHRAFDGTTSTYWMSAKLSSGGVSQAVLNCPSGIAIKPTTIYFSIGYISPLVIEGYNADSKSWQTLHTFTTTKNFTNSTVTLSTNNYYSSFRIKSTRGSSSNTQLVEFQIRSGTIRKEA